MKTLDRTSIFDSPSQLLEDLSPDKIKPMWSRVLIRDEHEADDKIGSIFLPQGDKGKDTRRIGIVVAVGPGDKHFEKGLVRDSDGNTSVDRRFLGKCEPCGGLGQILNAQAGVFETCPQCQGDGIKRFPMEVKVGDRVLYDRRRDAEFVIEGERYNLVFEEQSVLGVLE